MKQNAIALFLCISLLSCKDCLLYVGVDISIDILLKNEKGEDLLNPNTNGHLANSDIRIYFLENGIEREAYNPNLDCPRNYCILNEIDSSKIFKLNVEDKLEAKKAVTIVQWNILDRDTIIANIVKQEDECNTNTYCDSVWVNGQLKFPNLAFKPERKFVLIK